MAFLQRAIPRTYINKTKIKEPTEIDVNHRDYDPNKIIDEKKSSVYLHPEYVKMKVELDRALNNVKIVEKIVEKVKEVPVIVEKIVEDPGREQALEQLTDLNSKMGKKHKEQEDKLHSRLIYIESLLVKEQGDKKRIEAELQKKAEEVEFLRVENLTLSEKNEKKTVKLDLSAPRKLSKK